jgi:ribose transport system permease protein
MVEGSGRSRLSRFRAIMRDYPVIPLLFILTVLVATLEILQPGIVIREEGLFGLNERWITNTVKFAIPLAILAASQTITMLTGGIDLSVGIVATMASFVMATQVASGVDPVVAIPLALGCAALAGLASGVGVAFFRVHPLIMTLAVAIVVEGLLLVYQRGMLGVSAQIPEVITWLGTGVSFRVIPNALLVFVPLALLIGFTLKRTGFGRNLIAVGDNEGAARLDGVRVGRVLVLLDVI